MKQKYIRFDLEKVYQLRTHSIGGYGDWEPTIEQLRRVFLDQGILDGTLYKVKECNDDNWFIYSDTGRLRKIGVNLVDSLEITKEEYLDLILKEGLLEQDSG